MGHARAIINVDNADQQLHIFKKALRQDLSVRKVEELVRQLANNVNRRKQRSALSSTAK